MAHTYAEFQDRLENGTSIPISVDELLRIYLSGKFPDGSDFDGIKVSVTGTSLLGKVGIDQVTANANEVVVKGITMPTTLVHGQKTIASAGTEEAIGASTPLLSGVKVKALAANTGIVYVGANPVTSSTGFALAAGEEVFLEVANLATVFIDVSVNAEGVSFIGS